MASWKWEGQRGRSHWGPSDFWLGVCWDCVTQDTHRKRSGSEAGSREKSKGGELRAGHVEFEIPARHLGGTPSRWFYLRVWRPGGRGPHPFRYFRLISCIVCLDQALYLWRNNISLTFEGLENVILLNMFSQENKCSTFLIGVNERVEVVVF